MRRVFVLLSMALLMSALFAPSATGQQAAGAIAAPPEGSPPPPPPPEYQVTEDGTLIVGGDVLLDCRTLGIDDIPPTASPSARTEIKQTVKEQAAVCRANGFPPAEPLSFQQTLPDTGGFSLPVLAGGLMLAGGGLLVKRRLS
jgi:LPXTG-motif cell wall-anchored protein